MHSSIRLAALALLASACSSVQGGAGWPATPQRPRLSRNTRTTAPETFELEAGLALDPGDRFGLETMYKHGLHEDTELFASWTPYATVELPGEDAEGPGDLALGMRYRFWEDADARTSAALQGTTKLPTGSESEGLSSGETDFFAAAMVTHEPDERTTVTGFYELGILGDPRRPDTRFGHTLALAVTVEMQSDLTAFGELSSVDSPFAPDPLVALGGVAQRVSDSLVIDAALGVGLNSDAPDATLLVGLTTNLGRLRRQRPTGR